MLTAQQILDVARMQGIDAFFRGTPRGETIRCMSADHDTIADFSPSTDLEGAWGIRISRRDGDRWALVFQDLALNTDDVAAAALRIEGIVIPASTPGNLYSAIAASQTDGGS
jgi:hypothetical protein